MFPLVITRILLVENFGVMDAVKNVATKLVEVVVVCVLKLALTTCNTLPIGKAPLAITCPVEPVVITVPLVVGKVSVVVPDTAGDSNVIDPDVAPLRISLAKFSSF
jgi:hypothetical protein